MAKKKIWLWKILILLLQKEIFSDNRGNGAGKTTILKLISGVLKPILGKIKVYGKCIFVSQNPKSNVYRN